MDPLTDLSSIGGIVAATIALTQVLKAVLADAPLVSRIPTAVYAVLVSCALTYIARDVLHVLEGELPALLVQSVFQALMAFGVLTMPTWKKPIGDSTLARDTRDWSINGGHWVVLLGAVALSIGCGARGTAIAVAAENQVYQTLTRIDDAGDRLTGCVTPSTAQQPESCRTFNAAMQPTLAAAAAFNRSVRNQDLVEALALVNKLATLAEALERAVPSGVAQLQAERDRLLGELRALIQSVSSLAGGGR